MALRGAKALYAQERLPFTSSSSQADRRLCCRVELTEAGRGAHTQGVVQVGSRGLGWGIHATMEILRS